MKSSTIEELQRASKELQHAIYILNIKTRGDKELQDLEKFQSMMINLSHESDTLLNIISENKQ